VDVRRGSISFILLLGYLYFRLIGESYALVSIGLVSFVAAAQFAPPILLGIYWKGASRSGALAGLTALGPHHLLNLAGFDPITHAVFWSMLCNIGLLVGVSLFGRQKGLEQLQGAMFVDVYRKRVAGIEEAPLWHGTTRVSDLNPRSSRTTWTWIRSSGSSSRGSWCRRPSA